jgi:hypothetical protein
MVSGEFFSNVSSRGYWSASANNLHWNWETNCREISAYVKALYSYIVISIMGK